MGQEAIQGLTSKIVAYSLHAGDDRGLTWYHERAGAVWLLASRFHRSGKPDDAYPYFRELDAKGRLLPSREDAEALARSRVPSLAKALFEDVPGMRSRAFDKPGYVVGGIIGGRIRIRALADPDDPDRLLVAISMKLLPGELSLPTEWLIVVAAAFFPGTAPEALAVAVDLGGHPVGPDEIVFCQD